MLIIDFTMLETPKTSNFLIRIWANFFINAANNFHLRVSVEKMRKSSNTIRKEWSILEEACYLKKKAVQNRILYKTNTIHLLNKTLENVIFKTIELDLSVK